MNNAAAIEEIFTKHVTDLIPDVVAKVLSYEPDKLDKLYFPLVTMYYRLPQGAEVETGSGEDVDHEWSIYLYVGMSDFKDAQEQMRDVSNALVSNFRQHRSDYSLAPGLDMQARSLRRENPPLPSEELGWLRGSWVLTVRSTER